MEMFDSSLRRIFGSFGGSPYLFPLLRYIARTSPKYIDIEAYFRFMCKLYGFKRTKPKVICENLKTLQDFGLIRNDYGRYRATERAEPILRLEDAFSPEPLNKIYVWRQFSVRAEKNERKQFFDRVVDTLVDYNDFQNIGKLLSVDRYGLWLVERPSEKQLHSILMREDAKVLAGMISEFDEAEVIMRMQELKKLLRKTEADDELLQMLSNGYSLEQVFLHLMDSLNHTVADLEYAVMKNGYDVSRVSQHTTCVASKRPSIIRIFDTSQKILRELSPSEREEVYEDMSLMRSVDRIWEDMSVYAKEDELVRMGENFSQELLALERMFIRTESEVSLDKSDIYSSFELIRNARLRSKVPVRKLKRAIKNVSSKLKETNVYESNLIRKMIEELENRYNLT